MADVFGLSYAMICCDESTKLEDFSNEILVDAGPNGGFESAGVSGGLDFDKVGLRSYNLSEKLACSMVVSASVPCVCPVRSCSLFHTLAVAQARCMSLRKTPDIRNIDAKRVYRPMVQMLHKWFFWQRNALCQSLLALSLKGT